MSGNAGVPSLESLLGAAPGPAVIADGRNRIVGANPSAGRLFGYRGEELIGRELEEILPSLRAPNGSPSHLVHETVLGRHRDGRTLTLSAMIRPVPADRQVLTAAYLRSAETD